MPDFATVLEVKQRAKARLLAIPGVHAVGIGNKWIKGSATREPAIMILVVKKKPLSEVPPAEVIPDEIDGVKTDVYESDVPAPQVDDAPHRPLTGGIQLEGGLPLGEAGTLGCIARTDEPQPRIVALTNQHVVASVANGTPTQLTVTPVAAIPSTITIGGTNTPGSMIVVGVSPQPDGDPNPRNIEVFYVTDALDDRITIATIVAGLINSHASPGVTATANLGGITLNPDPGFTLLRFFALGFGPHAVDPAAGVRSSITVDPVTLNEHKVTLTGTAASDGFASVVVNIGGQTTTLGFMLLINKGDSASTIAQSLAGALSVSDFPGITATANGAEVTINGAAEVEFDIHSDRRVGQPRATFCSPCAVCCDRTIGTVIDARIQFDTAVIELKPGTQYKATIANIGAVTGTHFIQANESGVLHVFTRGRTTDHKSEGIVMALNMDGHVAGGNPPVFHRHYINGICIAGTAGRFSDNGDSGSAVVVISNDPNPPHQELHEVAAILFSGTPTMSFATPINDIMDNMEVIVETAASENDVKTVPAAAHAAAPIPHFAMRLQQVEREIMGAPEGAEVIEAVRRHAEEAQRLVNSNRRVATVWHRNGGPQILQSLVSMLQSPDHRLPEQFEGKPIAKCLEKIQAAFERYASADFAADLNRFGPRLIELCGFTYRQTLESLQEGITA